jgi:hypothetical protein
MKNIFEYICPPIDIETINIDELNSDNLNNDMSNNSISEKQNTMKSLVNFINEKLVLNKTIMNDDPNAPKVNMGGSGAGKKTVMNWRAQSAAYDKMKAWHEGRRKQNIGAMSDTKLEMNYRICVQQGYEKEARELMKEATKRNLDLE